MHKAPAVCLVLSCLLAVSQPTLADPVEGLTNFTAGTPAKADEVNGNFAEVTDSVNDNDARIVALEQRIASLEAQLENLMALNDYVTLETVNGHPTVRITAANLQVVNGTNDTRTATGTGNLLIGYDEARTGSAECSIGFDPEASAPVTNEEECTATGGVWATSHKSGSHYLVVGTEHNYTRWGGIVVGLQNTSNYDFASVSGGIHNSASGLGASVSGGFSNSARSFQASVSGGWANNADGSASSVLGGFQNLAAGAGSAVTGGTDNLANGTNSSVSGGSTRTAGGNSDWVAGSLFEED